MSFKICSKCKEILYEDDMFRVLKNGKYSKRCFNCSGRSSDEFIESMSKIFSPEEMEGLFNKNVIIGKIK